MEALLSIVSNGQTNAIPELSDSLSSTPMSPSSKRLRNPNAVSKFKGVVPQQNGHWGAQIYANHQRIWLGTFKTEKDAAMAYDSAAIRLRNVDSHRNFPWTNTTTEERLFQSHYNTEGVINMIRDGSYPSRFADFLSHSRTVHEDVRRDMGGWMTCRQLFQKELTPSDVGKLNRLVIPKKYAVKYFPLISESVEEHDQNGIVDDVQLVFHDRSMKLWKFRYCYWKSSQSFVFTRGWSRFVKEYQLEANDIICFYLCELRENAKGTKTFCMIGANRGEDKVGLADVADDCANMNMKVDLQLRLGQTTVDREKENKVEEEDDDSNEIEAADVMELKGPNVTSDSRTMAFKLFGVVVF